MCVCNDLVTFETIDDVEAVVDRNVRVRDERVVNTVKIVGSSWADFVFGA